MRRFIPLGRSLAETQEESPLIAMLLDEYYQRTLQTPPQSPTGEALEEEPAPSAERVAIAGGRTKKRPRRRNDRQHRRGSEGSGNPSRGHIPEGGAKK
jgi:ATP-dependent RNA helicase DeaD